MSWFQKLIPSRIRTETSARKKAVPEGLWSTCNQCSAILYNAELERNAYVCPRCDHHHRINARTRLELFLDENSYQEIAEEVEATDHLKFKDSKKYKDRITAAQKKTGEKEAIVAYKGQLLGEPIAAVAFEFSFIGGSMGSGVGERFFQAATICMQERIPLVCFSASGGARMQEAVISLMQMAKTSAALAKMAEMGIPFISVLTDPTYGGVSASLAMLGDVNVAEPKAMIGFAGPRVIEQTVRETLPEGFQTAEFLVEHGFVDMIIDRRQLREKLAKLLSYLKYYKQ